MKLALALWLTAAAAPPLTLDEVITSVERSHPTAAILDAEVRAAEAGRVAARGGFDLKLSGRAEVGTEGNSVSAKEKHEAWADLAQPLPLLGRPTLSLGYALDPFADFDETSQIGAVDAKVSVELWRDALIDDDRAKLATARLKVDASQAGRLGELLALESEATSAYWSWVVKGWALEIARSLETQALERQAAVEKQVEGGNLAAIDIVDNRRAVLSRHEKVVEAELGLREASLKLGIFLRTEEGRAAPPAPERLPPLPEVLRLVGPAEDLEAMVEIARASHPMLAKVSRELDAIAVELRLAENDAAPQVQLALGVRQDFEAAKGDGRELKAGLKVGMPLQLRKARGRASALRAGRRALEEKRRLLADKIEVEVRQAHAGLVAAHERARLADEAWRAARTVERAEARRVTLGDSEILRLNLREQATADSALRRAVAVAEVERQRARLRLAAGERLGPGPR